ncbi:MAG: 3'-5' exonuclease, partial [Gillisia sp.]
ATLIDFRANPQEKFEGEVEIVEETDGALEKLIEYVKDKSNYEVAILFRSNEELYKDFGLIQALVEPEGFKVEIKGSTSSFTRQREISCVLDTIRNRRMGSPIENRDGIRKYIDTEIKVKYPLWNKDLLDDFSNLFEYYYDQYNEESVYADFIEFVEDITAKDDGQLFKILKNQRKDLVRTVILTTIHRVKGMEYQNVIVPASIAKLPFDPRERTYTPEELEELIDEEKRLRSVAYSRAEKNLFAEIGERENSVENYCQFIPDAGVVSRGIPVKNGDNITMISWKARNGDANLELHSFLHEELTLGQRVHIGTDNYGNYGVFHQNRMLEKFSTRYSASYNEAKYHGIYIDSIVRYTVEDCLRYDEKHNTTYFQTWSQEAKSRGYIYIVNFFGYAVPANEWLSNQREMLERLNNNQRVNTLQ